MWYFERFDHCKSLVTYQDNYTETHRFDHLVKTSRLRYEVGVKDIWCEFRWKIIVCRAVAFSECVDRSPHG